MTTEKLRTEGYDIIVVSGEKDFLYDSDRRYMVFAPPEKPVIAKALHDKAAAHGRLLKSGMPPLPEGDSRQVRRQRGRMERKR